MNFCNTTLKVKNPDKPLKDIERSINKTYRKELLKPFVKAINEFNLIEPNDKIAIAISGGKDSLLLAKLFQELKRHNKFEFELVFLTMNPGFNKINVEQLEVNAKYLNFPLIIEKSNIFEILEKISKDQPCYMCAKMRRGFLYKKAKELGCNKLALAHHFNDVIETTLLNIFYAGQFKTMVPKIKAENYEEIELIRPMVYIHEKDIIRFTNYSGIQAMDCGCTVASKKISSKRREIKELIKEMKKTNPLIEKTIFTSATNINLNQVYGYINNNEEINFSEIYKNNIGGNKVE